MSSYDTIYCEIAALFSECETREDVETVRAEINDMLDDLAWEAQSLVMDKEFFPEDDIAG